MDHACPRSPRSERTARAAARRARRKLHNMGGAGGRRSTIAHVQTSIVFSSRRTSFLHTVRFFVSRDPILEWPLRWVLLDIGPAISGPAKKVHPQSRIPT